MNNENKITLITSYTIPVGDNIVTLEFRGGKIQPADFDALAEYVVLFKRQLERSGQEDKKQEPEPMWVLMASYQDGSMWFFGGSVGGVPRWHSDVKEAVHFKSEKEALNSKNIHELYVVEPVRTDKIVSVPGLKVEKAEPKGWFLAQKHGHDHWDFLYEFDSLDGNPIWSGSPSMVTPMPTREDAEALKKRHPDLANAIVIYTDVTCTEYKG